MSIFPSEVAAKSVQLLKELRPAATLMGYLVNPSNPAAHVYAEQASNAAKALGIAVHILNASTESDLDEAFASLAKADAQVWHGT
jgi:putative ABC transport system substrate-binding protein